LLPIKRELAAPPPSLQKDLAELLLLLLDCFHLEHVHLPVLNLIGAGERLVDAFAIGECARLGEHSHVVVVKIVVDKNFRISRQRRRRL
jgi:hypothetical protein